MWVVGFASAMTEGQSPGIVEKTLAAAQKIKFVLKSDKPAISSDFHGDCQLHILGTWVEE